MSTTVEIGRVRGFILDDPVAGVLDNTEYRLGGLGFVDVTSRVRNVSISRGKNRDLERYNAASVGVEFNNHDRYFDPIAGTEIDAIPRVPIRVRVDGADQFYGLVEDWNFDYQPSGDSIASVSGLDELTKLARQTVLPDGTATVQNSGARVSAVLDMLTVDWPASQRVVDVGVSTVEATVWEAQNALEYLQAVELSEQGQLFIGKSGNLIFRNRSSAAPRSDNLITFSDDGVNIPVQEFVVDYGTELMTNRVTVTNTLGTVVIDSQLSQVTYGLIAEEFDTVLASELDRFGEYVVAKYAQPEYRFQSVRVNLDSLSSGHRTSVLGVELGDVARLIFTPNNIGSPIDKYGQVIRIDHSIGVDRHDVTFGFAAADFASLVLDDTVFGRLDTNSLGF